MGTNLTLPVFCHGQAENLAQECLRGKLTSDLHEVIAAQ